MQKVEKSQAAWLDEYYINEPIFPESSESNPIQRSIETLKHQYIYNKQDKPRKRDSEIKRIFYRVLRTKHKNDVLNHRNIVSSLISLFHVILDLRQETVIDVVKNKIYSGSANQAENNKNEKVSMAKHQHSNYWDINSKSAINDEFDHIYSDVDK